MSFVATRWKFCSRFMRRATVSNINFSTGASGLSIKELIDGILCPTSPGASSYSTVQLTKQFASRWEGLSGVGAADSKVVTLTHLVERHGVDAKGVEEAVKNVSCPLSSKDVHDLRLLLTPRYERLFQTVLSLVPNGMAVIVSLRSDVKALCSAHPQLKALDTALQQQLSSWFSSGILEIRRITYSETPAAIIEKIAKRESVHPVKSLEDLRSRLAGGRRCFAFFHPSLPDEPLVFVHCALVPFMASSMNDIRDDTIADPCNPSAAIFYSINSTQPGLAGVELGNFLIKRVASKLRGEFPTLRTVATLSPIPRFRHWLLNKGKTEKNIFGDAEEAKLKFLAATGAPPKENAVNLFVST